MKFKTDTKFNRFISYTYALFAEHSILNIFWKNFHQIDDGLYRSAQVNPMTLKKYIKKYNLKEIISHRAEGKKSPLSIFEREICEEYGVKFQHVHLRSRLVPTKEKLIELKKVFKDIHKPALIHCKAGADRTSLAAIIYLYFKGENLQDAIKNHLSFWKYGHMKHSDAGIIDFYFEEFIKSGEKDLIEWTDKNHIRLEDEFKNKKNRFWNFINNKILKRE